MENQIEDRAGKPQLVKATLNLRKDEEKVGIEFNFMKGVNVTKYQPLLKKGVAVPENIKLSDDQKSQLNAVIEQPVSDEEFKKKYEELPDDNPVKQMTKSIFSNIGGMFKETAQKLAERDIKIDTAIEIAAKKSGAPIEHTTTIEEKKAQEESTSMKQEQADPSIYKPLLAKTQEQLDKEHNQNNLTRNQQTNEKIAQNLTQDQRDQMIQAYNMYAQATAAQGQQPIPFDEYVDQYIDIAKKQQEAYLQQQQMMAQYQPMQQVPQQPVQYVPMAPQQIPAPFYIY